MMSYIVVLKKRFTGKHFFLEIIIFFIFFNYLPAFSQENGWEKKLQIKGSFKNASGFRISEGNSAKWLKCENIFEVEPHFSLNQNIELHGVFRAYYDAVFDLEKSGWTDEFRFKKEIRRDNADTISDPIREVYADITWKRLFMRLGKQQIGWGEAIGVKMLDVINPQDMRELNQLDFEDSHIPLWMANFIYYPAIMGTSFQLLFIPDIEPNYLPPAGHPFASQFTNQLQKLEDQGIINLDKAPNAGKSVPRNLRNMEIGVRWYQNLPGVEYSLNYFYHWSDIPGIYAAEHLDSSINYNLKYHRMHTLGGSFTKVFNRFFGVEGVSLDGEVAVHLNDRVFCASPFSDSANPIGIKMAETDTFNYYLALYKYVFTDYLVKLQFFQFITLDYKDEYVVDEVENVLSLFLSTDYLQERVQPDLLWVYCDDGNLWVRGRCKLKATDNWTFNIGCNLYFEHPYGDQDNLFLELIYEF